MVFSDGYGNMIDKSSYMEITDKLLSSKNRLMQEFYKLNTLKTDLPTWGNQTVDEQERETVHFFFNIKKLYSSFKTINEFVDELSGKLKPNLKPKFYMLYEGEPNYDEVETELLRKLHNKLIDNFKTGLKFPIDRNMSYGEEYVSVLRTWDFDKVYDANVKLNDIIDQITRANLSTYEKYLAVYGWVSSFVYARESVKEPTSTSRRIVEVLNGNKIVCAGFVSLLTTLCNKLNIPAKEIVVFDGEVFHSRAIVKIVDHKYGINGLYQTDPTFDAGTNRANKMVGRSYFHHLLPVKQIDENAITNNDPAKRLFDFAGLEGEELDKKIELGLHKDGIAGYFELSNHKLMSTTLISYDEVNDYFENKRIYIKASDVYDKVTKSTLLKELELDRDKTMGKAVDKNKLYIKSLHTKVNQTEPISVDTFTEALAVAYSRVKALNNPNYQLAQGMKYAHEVADFNIKVGRNKINNKYKDLINQSTFTNLNDYNRLVAASNNSGPKTN